MEVHGNKKVLYCMEYKWKLVSLSVSLLSANAIADNYAIEARGDGMGGVGVVAGNFLTGSFYNPAITAIYRRNDDLGMIIPSFGVQFRNEDDLVGDLKDIASLLDKAIATGPSNEAEIESKLKSLKNSTASLELGGVVSIAIPNQFVAANLFGKAYAESFAQIDSYNSATGSTPSAINAELSGLDAVGIGVTEVGLSLAKYQTFLGQHISFGITPKLQRLYTYVYRANLNNYEFKDIRDNGAGETMFNFDAGFLWFYGPVRVGFSALNLVSRDIKSQTLEGTTVVSKIDSSQSRVFNPVSFDYQMRPQYTVGAGLVGDYASISVDYDLREEEKFTNFKDNSRMLRVGGELDIMRQLKLRAGWNKNLVYDDREDTITAGIGLSPLNLFQLDLAASYTNKNAMGAYINFVSHY